MDVPTTMKKLGIEQAIKVLYRDPEKNGAKLMDWADKFCGENFGPQRKVIRDVIENPDSPYHGFFLHLVRDVDREVLTTVAVNFFINANMTASPSTRICSGLAPCWRIRRCCGPW